MRMHLPAEEEKLQKAVDSALKAKGYRIEEGIAGSLSQTDEFYTQIIVMIPGHNASILPGVITSIVAGFGEPGAIVYWRIRPELQIKEMDTFSVYFRFLVSSKPAVHATSDDAWLAHAGPIRQ